MLCGFLMSFGSDASLSCQSHSLAMGLIPASLWLKQGPLTVKPGHPSPVRMPDSVPGPPTG